MSALGRGWGFRGRAFAALLLHLSLVGLVPMGEAFHDHGHTSHAGSHTDGSHEPDSDPTSECPLVLATTSAGVATPQAAAPELPSADRLVLEAVVDVPRPATTKTAVTARGPPSC